MSFLKNLMNKKVKQIFLPPQLPMNRIRNKEIPCDEMINAFVSESTRTIGITNVFTNEREPASNLKCTINKSTGSIKCESNENARQIHFTSPYICKPTNGIRRGVKITNDNGLKQVITQNTWCDDAVAQTREKIDAIFEK